MLSWLQHDGAWFGWKQEIHVTSDLSLSLPDSHHQAQEQHENSDVDLWSFNCPVRAHLPTLRVKAKDQVCVLTSVSACHLGNLITQFIDALFQKNRETTRRSKERKRRKTWHPGCCMPAWIDGGKGGRGQQGEEERAIDL